MSGNTFLRWLNDNLGLMLLALVLAFIVWLSAVFAADPNEECSAPASIPLEVNGLEDDMRLFGELPANATIRLFAPQSLCQRMAENSQSVQSYIDISGFEAGDYDLDVVYIVDNQYSPVRVLDFTPTRVSITLEEFITRTIPLTLNMTGQPAPGYSEGGTILSDSRVEVAGTRSIVDRIDMAVVSLDITDAVEEINVSRPVQLLDENGDIISGLDVTPSNVTIRKIIDRPGFFRDVSVRVLYSGAPEDGYRLTSITPSPQIITVFANEQSLIRELPGFLETEVIDLTGATDDIEQRLRLQLPEGVFVDGEQSVLVQVGIAAIESSLTLALPVERIGLAPEYDAIISPEMVDVLLTGPLPVLTNLQPLDVRVVLDLAGFEPGAHTVIPRIEVIPLGITIESVLPNAIDLEIIELPTPTPDPEADAAATPENTATPTPTGTP